MRKISLAKLGVPDFYVDPVAETRYGLQFWESVENGGWERNQLEDLVSRAKVGCFFIDVGASNGVYSLIMASLGCQVMAIEPNESQFKAMNLNLGLNPQLKITAKKGLVISSTIHDKFSPYALDLISSDPDKIEKFDFISFFKPSDVTVIKIDIEGGEWELMRDKRIVSYVLQHRNLEIFLSPHIGFFSENYNKGALHRFKFRISVLWEFLVLYKFARRANSIIYRGARITPRKLILQDRVFRGPGLREHIIFQFSR